MLIRIPASTLSTVFVLSLGLLATEERYVHYLIEPFSVCRFQSGLCADGNQIFLAEGRLNLNLVTSNGTITTPNAIQPSTGSLVFGR